MSTYIRLYVRFFLGILVIMHLNAALISSVRQGLSSTPRVTRQFFRPQRGISSLVLPMRPYESAEQDESSTSEQTADEQSYQAYARNLFSSPAWRKRAALLGAAGVATYAATASDDSAVGRVKTDVAEKFHQFKDNTLATGRAAVDRVHQQGSDLVGGVKDFATSVNEDRKRIIGGIKSGLGHNLEGITDYLLAEERAAQAEQQQRIMQAETERLAELDELRRKYISKGTSVMNYFETVPLDRLRYSLRTAYDRDDRADGLIRLLMSLSPENLQSLISRYQLLPKLSIIASYGRNTHANIVHNVLTATLVQNNWDDRGLQDLVAVLLDDAHGREYAETIAAYLPQHPPFSPSALRMVQHAGARGVYEQHNMWSSPLKYWSHGAESFEEDASEAERTILRQLVHTSPEAARVVAQFVVAIISTHEAAFVPFSVLELLADNPSALQVLVGNLTHEDLVHIAHATMREPDSTITEENLQEKVDALWQKLNANRRIK